MNETKEIKEILKECLEIGKCNQCEFRDEKRCMLVCRTLIEEVLEEIPERGEWEEFSNAGIWRVKCSVCGYAPGIRFWNSAFCPNCGAKMKNGY